MFVVRDARESDHRRGSQPAAAVAINDVVDVAGDQVKPRRPVFFIVTAPLEVGKYVRQSHCAEHTGLLGDLQRARIQFFGIRTIETPAMNNTRKWGVGVCDLGKNLPQVVLRIGRYHQLVSTLSRKLVASSDANRAVAVLPHLFGKDIGHSAAIGKDEISGRSLLLVVWIRIARRIDNHLRPERDKHGLFSLFVVQRTDERTHVAEATLGQQRLPLVPFDQRRFTAKFRVSEAPPTFQQPEDVVPHGAAANDFQEHQHAAGVETRLHVRQRLFQLAGRVQNVGGQDYVEPVRLDALLLRRFFHVEDSVLDEWEFGELFPCGGQERRADVCEQIFGAVCGQHREHVACQRAGPRAYFQHPQRPPPRQSSDGLGDGDLDQLVVRGEVAAAGVEVLQQLSRTAGEE